MKKDVNVTGIIWGLCLIIFGFVLMGNLLGLWSLTIFFKGWWTLLIIIPSLVGLILKDEKDSSLFFLILGLTLLLAARDIIDYNIVYKVMICAFIIILGCKILYKSMVEKERKVEIKKNYNAIFSEINEKITGKVEDTKLISVFGGITLDLSKAEIKKDIYVDMVCCFGMIDMIIPDNVNIEKSGFDTFGGLENRSVNSDENKVTIHINRTCVFGGIEIK